MYIFLKNTVFVINFHGIFDFHSNRKPFGITYSSYLMGLPLGGGGACEVKNSAFFHFMVLNFS